jgi:uncharacterized protein YpmB
MLLDIMMKGVLVIIIIVAIVLSAGAFFMFGSSDKQDSIQDQKPASNDDVEDKGLLSGNVLDSPLAKSLPGFDVAYNKAKEVIPDPQLISHDYRGKKEGELDVATNPGMSVRYVYQFYKGVKEIYYNDYYYGKTGRKYLAYDTYRISLLDDDLSEISSERDNDLLIFYNRSPINMDIPMNIGFEKASKKVAETELYNCLVNLEGKSPEKEKESAAFGNGMGTYLKVISQLEGTDSPVWEINVGSSAEFAFFFVNIETGNIDYIKRIIFDPACENIDVGVETDIERR